MRFTQRSLANVLSGASVLLVALTSGVGDQALADQIHYTIKLVTNDGNILNLPITDSPVILSCASTAANDAGTGQATLLYSTATNEIYGNGYDYTGDFKNFSTGTQAHLMYCDQNGSVEIRQFSLTQLILSNRGTTQTVVIMFTY